MIKIKKPDEPLEFLPLPEPENWKANVLMTAPGWFWLHSYKIKEWRGEGKGLVGGAGMCEEAKKMFAEKTKKYGPAPTDLTYRFEYRDDSKKSLSRIIGEIMRK